MTADSGDSGETGRAVWQSRDGKHWANDKQACLWWKVTKTHDKFSSSLYIQSFVDDSSSTKHWGLQCSNNLTLISITRSAETSRFLLLSSLSFLCFVKRVEKESREKKAPATMVKVEDPYGGSTDENTDAEAEEDHPIPELPGLCLCSYRHILHGSLVRSCSCDRNRCPFFLVGHCTHWQKVIGWLSAFQQHQTQMPAYFSSSLYRTAPSITTPTPHLMPSFVFPFSHFI